MEWWLTSFWMINPLDWYLVGYFPLFPLRLSQLNMGIQTNVFKENPWIWEYYMNDHMNEMVAFMQLTYMDKIWWHGLSLQKWQHGYYWILWMKFKISSIYLNITHMFHTCSQLSFPFMYYTISFMRIHPHPHCIWPKWSTFWMGQMKLACWLCEHLVNFSQPTN